MVTQRQFQYLEVPWTTHGAISIKDCPNQLFIYNITQKGACEGPHKGMLTDVVFKESLVGDHRCFDLKWQ